jgi:hypothetical protein
LATFDSTQAGEAVVRAWREEANCSAACEAFAVFATRLLISIGPHEVGFVDDDARDGLALLALLGDELEAAAELVDRRRDGLRVG